jgi:hypothetical protein
MDFSMPNCARNPESGSGSRCRRSAGVIVLTGLILTTAACTERSDGQRFEMRHLDASWANGHLNVSFEQQLTLSTEARNALVHGVPLTLEVEFILRNTHQTRTGENTVSYVISYLPLSQHYQVSESGVDSVKTFPRLRHAMADLSRLKVSIETGALPAGDYELLAQSRLDKDSLPPPMRLPVRFSPKWKHHSAWTSWPIEINPEA